ncbi:MAG TPA: TetR/AcrR family transcriptional regulator [Acidobacteriaceae bacterium]
MNPLGHTATHAKGPDRRVQRTRRLLHSALMSLIVQKKYELITVQEILDRADVGRSTFYMHFRDKDDLLFSGFEYLQAVLDSAVGVSNKAPGKSHEKIIGFSAAMFEHAQEYRRVNRALLGSTAEAVVRRRIHSVLAGFVSRELKFELQHRKGKSIPVSPELLVHFLVSSYISVLMWWLNSKNQLSPAEVDLSYRQLVLPSLDAIFGTR